MTDSIFGHDRLDVYRLVIEPDAVSESAAEYAADIDYEHEHR